MHTNSGRRPTGKRATHMNSGLLWMHPRASKHTPNQPQRRAARRDSGSSKGSINGSTLPVLMQGAARLPLHCTRS